MSKSTKADESAIAQLFVPMDSGTIQVTKTLKHEHIASLSDDAIISNLAIQLFEIERLEAKLSEHRKIRDDLKAELKSRQPKGKIGRPINNDGWLEIVQKFILKYEEQKRINPELTVKALVTSLLSPLAENKTVLNRRVKTFTNNISKHRQDL